jgi:hypothetical protein
VVPFVRRLVHAPPTHAEPGTQSPSPPQVVLQAPLPPQLKGLQLTVCCAHTPAPLQKPVGVDVEPVHEAVPHDVVVGAFWQLPAPSHAPVSPQGGAAVQRPCGSACEGSTSLHAPSRPETLQARHVPHADVEQQTPSTQKLPDRHSSLVAHDWPRRFLSPQRFVLTSQMLGEAQSPSATHVVLQATPLHAKGAHGSAVAARHVPAPSHVRASISVVAPMGHVAGAHVVPPA